MATVLCVDDEPSVGAVVEPTLAKLGHRPLLVSGVEEALAMVARTPIDLIIADYRMPRHTGLGLLAMLEKEGLRIPVIIMTDNSSIQNAVTSIKSGAIGYLTRPVRPEALEIAVQQALAVVRLRRENEAYRRELLKFRTARAIVGDSDRLRRVMDVISAVAPTRATVLLDGESGTGKELFARAIHDQSPRSDGPFVTIDCAAMPDGLVESALFGHERGAFTGAMVRTAGAFERAHDGTLLLDEISELRLDLQAKLLRVIQEQELERVGGSQAIRVDVRIIASTSRDLQREVAAGRFRSDLYYRLAVVPIRAPSLRERQDDIPRLAHHFARRAAEQLGVPVPPIAPEALQLLQRYRWPGNVRELGTVIERAVILARGGMLTPSAFLSYLHDLPLPTSDAAAPAPPPALATAPLAGASAAPVFNLHELERKAIGRALEATSGNRTRAAKLLGISERTLRNKLNTPRIPEPADG